MSNVKVQRCPSMTKDNFVMRKNTMSESSAGTALQVTRVLVDAHRTCPRFKLPEPVIRTRFLTDDTC